MKKRYGNLDLLKILCIYMIIIHHYATWSGWTFESGFHLNKLTAQTMLVGGKLGVNIFVMITGFFLIRSNIKMKSIVKIWVETTVFSLAIYFVLIGFQLIDIHFDFLTLIRKILPVIFNEYWFVTAYSLMYFCIPWVNKLILSNTIVNMKKYLIILFFVLSVYTFIFFEKGVNFSNPVWFIYLYSIGAFIRLNEHKVKKTSFVLLTFLFVTLFIIGIIINISLQFFFSNQETIIFKVLKMLGWSETIFYTRDASPLLLPMAIVLFSIFLKLKISSTKLLTYLANASFGVYLFQSAKWFSVSFIWRKVVNGAQYYASSKIFIHGIVSAFLIFIVGILAYVVLLPIIKYFQYLSMKIINTLVKT